MIFHNAEQGTETWLNARKGVVTASRFKDARDRLKSGAPSKACLLYAMDVARERAGGAAPTKFQSAAMRIGTEQEPLTRQAYEVKTGALVEEVGFITTDDRKFGCSVDGMVGRDGAIEIKTVVSSDTLFTVLAGEFGEYLDQVYGAMWLLGLKWVDLVISAPDLAHLGLDLSIHRIERDDDRIESMERDLIEFERLVTQYERELRRKAVPAA